MVVVMMRVENVRQSPPSFREFLLVRGGAGRVHGGGLACFGVVDQVPVVDAGSVDVKRESGPKVRIAWQDN